MLTKGLDNVPGTAGNDTISGAVDNVNGELNTMSGLDVVNGGVGTDTLKIAFNDAATAAVALPTISNVEIVEVQATQAFTINTTTVAGVTNLNVTKATANAGVTAATTTDISTAATAGTITVDGGKNITVTDATADKDIAIGATTVNAGTITVTDSKQGNGKIEIDGGTAVTVTATADQTTTGGTAGAITVGDTAAGNLAADMASGAVAITQNLNSDGTAALTGSAITVEGGTTVNVNVNATVTAKNETASGSITAGAITVTSGGSTTEVTATQAYSETEFTKAGTAVVKETSVVTFAELLAGKTVAFNGLTFTAAKDLTAEQVAAAFANLTAADTQSATGPTANGLYTGTFNTAVWTSGAVSGKTVTFTAQDDQEGDLVFTGTAATLPTQVKAAGTAVVNDVTSANAMTYGVVRVDDVATASITKVTLDGYASADLGKTGTDLNALTTLSLANSAGAVDLATSATTLGLTLNNVTGAAAIDIDQTAATVATLNVTTTGKASSVTLTGIAVKDLNVSGDQTLTLAGTTTALENVVVSGSAGLDISTVSANAAKSINTTATTGTVTAKIDAGVATYTGGAGVDNVTTVTTTTPTKAISLGAGNDKLTLVTGTTASTSTLDGGADTDTLSMVAANAVTASASTAFATKVVNFEKLVLTGATGAQEVEADVLGNYNDIEVSGAIAGHVLTLDGVTSGVTLRLNDNSNIQTVLAVTDAEKVANSTDVVNVVIGASGENGGVDSNGIVKADSVETVNISVTDITTKQTPTDTKADAQSLTLVATGAKTINVTGDTALTLNTAANQKVTLIDGSTATGALTVTAAGGVASTIKGGTAADTLTASSGQLAGGVDNKTGASAAITADATPGHAITKAVYTVNLAGLAFADAGDTLTLDTAANGGETVFTSTGAHTAAQVATAMIGAGTVTIDTVVYDVTAGANGTTIVLTAQTAANEADNIVLAVTDGGGAAPTNATTASQAITTQGYVAAVKEVATVVLTDGTNTGLTLGDTMALTVAGTTYTYTATAATETMDVAGAGLAALINAGGLVTSATYTAGTDTLAITALTATTTNIGVSAYTITDAAAGAAKGDTLIGGDGNDTLTAGTLATLTGGAGNDTFKMVTGLANINSYSSITDFSSGDVLDTTGTDFIASGVNLASTAVFSDFVNAAIAQSDTGDVIWFQKEGNTYVVQNQSNHATTFDVTQDFIIEIVGLKDLSAASFNTTNGFLEMA